MKSILFEEFLKKENDININDDLFRQKDPGERKELKNDSDI